MNMKRRYYKCTGAMFSAVAEAEYYDCLDDVLEHIAEWWDDGRGEPGETLGIEICELTDEEWAALED